MYNQNFSEKSPIILQMTFMATVSICKLLNSSVELALHQVGVYQLFHCQVNKIYVGSNTAEKQSLAKRIKPPPPSESSYDSCHMRFTCLKKLIKQVLGYRAATIPD